MKTLLLSIIFILSALSFIGCSSQKDSGTMNPSDDANAAMENGSNSSQLMQTSSATDTNRCSSMHTTSTSMMSGGMMDSTADSSMMQNHDSTQCLSQHK